MADGDPLRIGNESVPGVRDFSASSTRWLKDPLTGVPGTQGSALILFNNLPTRPFPQLGINVPRLPQEVSCIEAICSGWRPGPGGGPEGRTVERLYGTGVLAAGTLGGFFFGDDDPGLPGVRGRSPGIGVGGQGTFGVLGRGVTSGVEGSSFGPGFGVLGSSGQTARPRPTTIAGVFGEGHAQLAHPGVAGMAHAPGAAGVIGWGSPRGGGRGVEGWEVGAGHAGLFNGFTEVRFRDFVVSPGAKRFRIDHPLDPENKYLQHASVESPDMKNVYDGDVQLDEDGTAIVKLPEWFEALNRDYRYQLTAIGEAAPALHIAEEISDNRFKIAGGRAGMKVCWQVTGNRKDRAAEANPPVVELEKPEEDRGRYLVPELYDAPEEQRIGGPRPQFTPPTVVPSEDVLQEVRRRVEEAITSEPPETTQP